MENDTYLTIVTNQVMIVSHDMSLSSYDEPHYMKYKVNGVSTLNQLLTVNVAGKTFLVLDREKDLWIPLSSVVKAYSGSHKKDEDYAKELTI